MPYVRPGRHETLNVLSKHAVYVPVLIVRTTKDKVLAMSEKSIREGYEHSGAQNGNNVQFSSQQTLAEAESQLLVRAEQDAEELASKNYNPNVYPLIYVSKGWFIFVSLVSRSWFTHFLDDSDSIKKLVEETLNMIQDDGAYKSCVAAQVVDVQQKISLAVTESVRLLRRAHGDFRAGVRVNNKHTNDF